MLELERCEYEVDYLRMRDGREIDFIAERAGDPPLLIQVSLETTADETWEREVRSLEAAARAFPRAIPLLITLDPTPPARDLPHPVQWKPASGWLLETYNHPPRTP